MPHYACDVVISNLIVRDFGSASTPTALTVALMTGHSEPQRNARAEFSAAPRPFGERFDSAGVKLNQPARKPQPDAEAGFAEIVMMISGEGIEDDR